MAFSQSLRDSVLNLFRATNITAPTTVYVALLTTDASDETGTGLVEVSTGTWTNYARKSVTFGAPSGTVPRQIANSGTVDFGTAAVGGGSTVNVVAYAFYDAATAGTFLGHNTLTGGTAGITNGTAVTFAAGALTVSD